MNKIIIAFPKQEIALNIKKILAQSGYSVVAVCATGAQALAAMNDLEDGILICGYRFIDMMYDELLEYLPKGFQMLLIASANNSLDSEAGNLLCLNTPLKVHELLEAVDALEHSLHRRKKKERLKPKVRTEEEQALIDAAKDALMRQHGLSEGEAHRYMQKRSMDNGTGLVETAEMILALMRQG